MDINVKTGGRADGSIAIGQAELIAAEPKGAAKPKKIDELLPRPGVTVTEKGVAEMLLDARYETAKHTIDNMVDTPEERRAKEERRLEEEEWNDRKAEAETRADRNAALRQEDPGSVSFV